MLVMKLDGARGATAHAARVQKRTAATVALPDLAPNGGWNMSGGMSWGRRCRVAAAHRTRARAPRWRVPERVRARWRVPERVRARWRGVALQLRPRWCATLDVVVHGPRRRVTFRHYHIVVAHCAAAVRPSNAASHTCESSASRPRSRARGAGAPRGPREAAGARGDLARARGGRRRPGRP